MGFWRNIKFSFKIFLKNWNLKYRNSRILWSIEIWWTLNTRYVLIFLQFSNTITFILLYLVGMLVGQKFSRDDVAYQRCNITLFLLNFLILATEEFWKIKLTSELWTIHLLWVEPWRVTLRGNYFYKCWEPRIHSPLGLNFKQV